MALSIDTRHSALSEDDEQTKSPYSTNDDLYNETSPLLHDDEPPTRLLPKPRKLRSPKSIMVILLVVLIFVSFGDQLTESPETRIFESVICYRYYEKNDPSKILLGRDEVGPGAIGGVNEMDCKADQVQDQLASLLGYQNFFDGFPLLALALPFGWAADRYGRWPFLFLNVVQFAARKLWSQLVTWHWQVFDIRAVWAGSAFALLGGGSPVATNLFFVVLSDITPDADRAAAFFRAGAASISAHIIVPPLAAWLMRYSPWYPSLAGSALFIIAAVLFCFAPETIHYREASHSHHETVVPSPGSAASRAIQSTNFARRWCSRLKSSTAFLVDDWRVPVLISTFFAHILVGNIGRLVLQYLSKRYALTLSKATLLTTIRNAGNLLLLFVILPYLSKAVMRVCGWSSQQKDLYLSRLSWGFMALGWLTVAASPNIPTVAISLAIASFGGGGALLVRSFLTSLLEPHHIATTYSIISITDTLGSMFGAPMLAELFKRGLSLGGGWVGLPFYFIGFLSAAFTGVLLLIKLKKGEDSRSGVEGE